MQQCTFSLPSQEQGCQDEGIFVPLGFSVYAVELACNFQWLKDTVVLQSPDLIDAT